MSTNSTPLMRQYAEIKQQYADCLLLFQVGDFYEFFYDDARIASSVLGITLTSRDKNKQDAIPLCGIPVHALHHYIPKLLQEKYRVALCQQLEEPKPGTVVKRGVVQVFTPGTLIDSSLLNPIKSSYICSIAVHENQCGLVFGELLSAQLLVTVITKDIIKAFESELMRFFPDEIIIHNAGIYKNKIETACSGFSVTFFEADAQTLSDAHAWIDNAADITIRTSLLQNDSMVQSLSAFYGYLKKNKHNVIDNFRHIAFYKPDDYMVLDAATQRTLEIVDHNHTNIQQGHTLFSVLNQAETAMGSRMIKKWLVRPLVHYDTIQARLETVELLVNNYHIAHECGTFLHNIGDLERVVGRIALKKATVQDYCALRNALRSFKDIIIWSARSPIIDYVKNVCLGFEQLLEMLESALSEDPVTQGIIKTGYDASFDHIKQIALHNNDAIEKLENAEREKTGIASLKIRYNSVHGYYIEITKNHLDAVPTEYIRHQTLVGKERYTIPALKVLEMEIMHAKSYADEIEKKLFDAVQDTVYGYIAPLRKVAQALAQLDALLGFARVAYMFHYVKPILAAPHIIIEQGRHPVIDTILKHSCIANDIHMNSEDARTLIITGPNMGGKSTYLRQAALLQIMAQAGSFVPAQHAALPIVDRIFTRIGAGDDLARGKSTFLVEMEEVATICTHATKNSLVILDEVGRGTSTYDGIALAQAILEYLHTTVKPYCLFATHYHEMTQMASLMPGIRNYYASSMRTASGLLLLYKIVPGIADGSFGIDVAKLAGLPSSIIARAHQLLTNFDTATAVKMMPAMVDKELISHQGSDQYQEIIDALKTINLDALSPRAVVAYVEALQEKLHERM